MDVKKIWDEGDYKKPSVYFCDSLTAMENENGEVNWLNSNLIVVSDDTSILTLMDKDGNIFFTSRNKCDVRGDRYVCLGPLYSTPFPGDSRKIQYVRREILPVVSQDVYPAT